MVENYSASLTQPIKPVEGGTISYHGLIVAPTQQKMETTDQSVSQSGGHRSLTYSLENFHEPSSIKSNHSYLFEARCVSMALRFGPLIVQRFSQQQEEFFEVPSAGYHGVSVAIRVPFHFLARVTLSLFVMRQSYQCLSFSLRWNVSFPKVVPNSAPIVRLARIGDICAMENLFKSRRASLSDSKSDGTSLLHVSYLLVTAVRILLILYRLLLRRTITSSLTIF